jgi:uncharacterized protein DUF2795
MEDCAPDSSRETMGDKRDEHGPRRDAPGMTPRDVEERGSMARLLSGVDYPATPRTLAAHAAHVGAPDVAVIALEQLPERSYADFADVTGQLDHGHEQRRF